MIREFPRMVAPPIIMAMVVCMISALITLVLTLNYTSALMVIFLGLVAILFMISYSKAWLSLLLLLLLFPAVRISGDNILLMDIMLLSLAVIGLVNLVINQVYLPTHRISYYLFLLILLGSAIIGFGYWFDQKINKHIWYFTFTILLYWLSLGSFQYFFQTMKRLRTFFLVILWVGVLHSVFGLIMFWGGWQTASGLGIVADKVQHDLFVTRNYQVSGFLGIGLLGRLQTNPLIPLLMVSLPITIGFVLVEQKRRQGTAGNSTTDRSALLPGNIVRKLRVMITSHTLSSFGYAIKARFLGVLRTRLFWYWIAFSVQAIAFFFTFSYTGIIFLMIGLLTLAILDRKRRNMVAISLVIVLFTVIFPSLGSSVTMRSEDNITRWFDGFHLITRDWIWGSGWNMMPASISSMNSQIHNSYLYIWNNFGIIGFMILLLILFQYFHDLLRTYKQSDGEKRIWLMVICAIFVSFLLEGLTSHTFFYGPAALLFWLLYGIVVNLKQRKVVFGITETKLRF